jgi:8-oxo-dGTP pyrophosphatase MutT (NUDIX family)
MMKFCWRIKNFLFSFFSKKTVGARALILQDEQILLVKHTYMPGWCTVGGGIDPGESPLQALQRELQEEVGIELKSPPPILSFYYSNKEDRDDYVILYVCTDFIKQEPTTSDEIAEAKWFPLTQLPSDITPATQRRIEEYLDQRPLSDRW